MSRVVPCRQTDMTKLIVTFHNFANAPRKGGSVSRQRRLVLKGVSLKFCNVTQQIKYYYYYYYYYYTYLATGKQSHK
jgi:hypothetical protein